MRQVYVKISPRPTCPNCKGRMRLVLPKKYQDWYPFFGCEKHPRCDGTVRAAIKNPEDMMPWDYPVDYQSAWVYD